jgi:hypothetical protein
MCRGNMVNKKIGNNKENASMISTAAQGEFFERQLVGLVGRTGGDAIRKW